jgi:hypothetical protein
MERLVFDNDSGSSGPRVIVANLAIHFIPLECCLLIAGKQLSIRLQLHPNPLAR